MLDRDEIRRALHAFFTKGDVFEIRVLDAVTQGYMRPHVESGYFDFEHIDDVPHALDHIKRYKGIYFTCNPVNRDLLARCVNRITNRTKEPSTSDNDILRRRWLLIDCDAVRPSGISSNEDEHNAAHDKAIEIKEGLSSLGYPDPIMTDSGNGAQLMYAIDMPTEDNGLIRKVIYEIAKVSSDAVNVDLTVHNPARIWRLPGTMNCKGDSTEERPHRMAHIVEMPEQIQFVSDEQLRIVAGPDNEIQSVPQSEGFYYENGFDIGWWVKRYLPELGEPIPWNGGRKWIFDVCPFNHDHANKSAVLMEMPSGAIAFKCHHNGCAGNDWKKLREMKEPMITRAHQSFDGVDISSISHQKTQSHDSVTAEDVDRMESESSKEAPWRLVTSDDVEKAISGTLLGDLTDIYGCVTEPKLPIEASLPKALVTIGCCLSGEATKEELDKRGGGNLGSAFLSGVNRAKLIIKTGGGQGINFYAITVGNSASGKDVGNLIKDFANFPNPDIHSVTDDASEAKYLIGTSGSAEGIVDCLSKKPNGLLTISELRNWLDERHWMHNAMNLLTEAWDGYSFCYALSQRSGANTRNVPYCSPSAIANIQPETFARLATPALIETGNFGRWLFAPMPRFYGDPRNFDHNELLAKMKGITEIFQRKCGVIDVPDGYAKELKDMFAGKMDSVLDPSWGRLVHQYYPRFAAVLSVTKDYRTHGNTITITEDAWARARVLTIWFVANAERMLLQVNEDNRIVQERETNYKKIFKAVDVLYRKTKMPVQISAVSRFGVRFGGVRTTAKERAEALNELVARGVLAMEGSGYVPLNVPEDYR